MGVSGQLQDALSVVPPPQERTPEWSLNRRLGEPHTWSGHFLEDKDLISLPGRNQTLDCPACMVVNLLTAVSWI